MAIPWWREATDAVKNAIAPVTKPPGWPEEEKPKPDLRGMIPPAMNIPGVPGGQAPVAQATMGVQRPAVDAQANKQWWQENVTAPLQQAGKRIGEAGQGNYVPVPAPDVGKLAAGAAQGGMGLVTAGVPSPLAKFIAPKVTGYQVVPGLQQMGQAVAEPAKALAKDIQETPIIGKPEAVGKEVINLVSGYGVAESRLVEDVIGALVPTVTAYKQAVQEGKTLAEAAEIATQAGDKAVNQQGMGRIAYTLASKFLTPMSLATSLIPGATLASYAFLDYSGGYEKAQPIMERAAQMATEGATLDQIEAELADPLAEAIGRAVFAPSNLIGIGAAERRTAGQIVRSQEYWTTASKITLAEKEALFAAGKFRRPMGWIGRQLERISPRNPAAVAASIYEDVGDVARMLGQKSGGDPDVLRQLLIATAKLGSDKVDEVADAKRVLEAANMGEIPFSEAGQGLTIFLRRSMQEAEAVAEAEGKAIQRGLPGLGDPINYKTFDKIVGKKTVDDAVIALQNHYVDTIAEMTKTKFVAGSFQDIRFLEANPVKKLINRVYTGLTTYAYLGYSPSFVARNFMYDGFLSMIDGNSTFWTTEAVRKWADETIGFYPGRAVAGIGAGGYGRKSMTESVKDIGLLSSIRGMWKGNITDTIRNGPMLDTAGRIESYRSLLVWAAGSRRAWNQVWQYGVSIPYSVVVERLPAQSRKLWMARAMSVRTDRDVALALRDIDAGTYLADNLLDPDVMRLIDNVEHGFGDELRTVVKGITPEEAATKIRSSYDSLDDFIAKAGDAPAVATRNIEAIEDMDIVRAFAPDKADWFARRIAEGRLQRDQSAAMVHGLAAQTGSPEVNRVVTDLAGQISKRRLETYNAADQLYLQRKRGEITFDFERAEKTRLWTEFKQWQDQLWGQSLESLSEADGRVARIARFEEAKTSNATYTMAQTRDVWRRLRGGEISLEGAVKEVDDLWLAHNEYSVRSYEDLWRQFGGDPEKGPLEVVGYTPRKPTIQEMRMSLAIEAQNAGISGIHVKANGEMVTNKRLLNTINKDRRAAGLPEVRNVNELDEDGLMMATDSFVKRQKPQETTLVQPVEPVKAEVVEKVEPIRFSDDAERVFAQAKAYFEREGKPYNEAEIRTIAGGIRGLPGAGANDVPSVLEAIQYENIDALRLLAKDAAKKETGVYIEDMKIFRGQRAQSILDVIDGRKEVVKPIPPEVIETSSEDVVRHIEQSATTEGIVPHRAVISTENKMRLKPLVDDLIAQMQKHAATPVERLTKEQAAGLKAWFESMRPRLTEAKMTAARAGVLERDFVLHNYDDKRLHDSLLSYAFIFSFWPTRTMANWGRRFANNPALAAQLTRLLKAQEQMNADLPESYRHNFRVWVGGTQYLFNLFDTFMPLMRVVSAFRERGRGEKQITQLNAKLEKETDPVIRKAIEQQIGVYKRGLMIEEAGSWGIGSVNPILQMAQALSLMSMGDQEGALATYGYTSNITRLVKAATALAGIGPSGGVVLERQLWQNNVPFQGGDYWERNRVPKALYKMVNDGQITYEEFADAVYAQKGDIYERGMQAAAVERAPGTIIGSLFGTGFKPYSVTDVEISQGDDEWYGIISNWDNYTEEQRSALMDAHNAKYPYHFGVRMGRQWGTQRDEAMAWLVLQRIPPGGVVGNTAKETALINETLLGQWYDTGSLEGWSESDRMIFMGAILKAAETYKVPNAMTKAEWDDVKKRKRALDKAVSAAFPEYQDQNTQYCRLRDQSQDWADAYLLDHPGLRKAWNMQRDEMLKDPLLFAYYGKEDAAEQQGMDWLKDRMASKYGDGWWDTYQMYLSATDDARTVIGNENPYIYDAMEEYATGKDVLRTFPPPTPQVKPKPVELRAGEQPPMPATEVRTEPTFTMPAASNPNVDQWRAEIEKNAQEVGIDPRIIATVIQIESGGDPYAMGGSFDTGLMQVVAQESGKSWATERPTQAELFAPAFNIQYGTTMLAGLITKNGGDVRKALAEYNTGSADVTTADAKKYLADYDAAWESLWQDNAPAAPTGDWFARMEGAMGDPLKWQYMHGNQDGLTKQIRSSMFDYLREQYPGAAEAWDEYDMRKDRGGDYKAFLKARPFMTEYRDRKAAMQAFMQANPLTPGGSEDQLKGYMAALFSQRGEQQLVWARDARYVRMPPQTAGRSRRARSFGPKKKHGPLPPVEEDFEVWWARWKAAHRGGGETFWNIRTR